MDREKVIGGLEACTGETNDCAGHTCPYWDFDDSAVSHGCRIQMELDALSLLKEQKAVKPYIDIDEAKCPICKVKLTRQELLGDDVLFEDFFDYCPHCGRSVKWE